MGYQRKDLSAELPEDEYCQSVSLVIRMLCLRAKDIVLNMKKTEDYQLSDVKNYVPIAAYQDGVKISYNKVTKPEATEKKDFYVSPFELRIYIKGCLVDITVQKDGLIRLVFEEDLISAVTPPFIKEPKSFSDNNYYDKGMKWCRYSKKEREAFVHDFQLL